MTKPEKVIRCPHCGMKFSFTEGVRVGHVKPTDILSKSERAIDIIANGIEKLYMIIEEEHND